MYNKNIKQEFLNTISKKNSQGVAASTFEMVEPYETELNKDICFFSEGEIKKVIPAISVARGGTANRGPRIQALCNYAKWCITNGISGIDEDMFSNLKGDPTEKIRQYMVKDPAHLDMILNTIFRPTPAGAVDNIYRAAYWLAFSGMEKESMITLQENQIDLANKTVTDDNGSYDLYPESIEVIESCMTLKSFRLFHPRYNGAGEDPRVDKPGYVLRGTSDVFNWQLMQELISRKFRMLNKAGITVKGPHASAIIAIATVVQTSGLFYRMYLATKRGCPVDFKSEVEKDIKKINYSCRGRYSYEGLVSTKNSQYIADYHKWFQTFYDTSK